MSRYVTSLCDFKQKNQKTVYIQQRLHSEVKNTKTAEPPAHPNPSSFTVRISSLFENTPFQRALQLPKALCKINFCGRFRRVSRRGGRGPERAPHSAVPATRQSRGRTRTTRGAQRAQAAPPPPTRRRPPPAGGADPRAEPHTGERAGRAPRPAGPRQPPTGTPTAGAARPPGPRPGCRLPPGTRVKVSAAKTRSPRS